MPIILLRLNVIKIFLLIRNSENEQRSINGKKKYDPEAGSLTVE